MEFTNPLAGTAGSTQLTGSQFLYSRSRMKVKVTCLAQSSRLWLHSPQDTVPTSFGPWKINGLEHFISKLASHSHFSLDQCKISLAK